MIKLKDLINEIQVTNQSKIPISLSPHNDDSTFYYNTPINGVAISSNDDSEPITDDSESVLINVVNNMVPKVLDMLNKYGIPQSPDYSFWSDGDDDEDTSFFNFSPKKVQIIQS